MTSEHDFIDALVTDLRPVTPAPSWARSFWTWSISTGCLVVAAFLMTGSFRSGFGADLWESSRFGLEFAIGLGAGLSAIWAGLESGVPGAPARSRLWLVPTALFIAWAGMLIWSILEPPLAPSMLGKRPFCLIQTMLFSLPPLVLAIHMLRRRAMMASGMCGALVGAGSAAIPALLMQIACMIDPMHGLKSHLAPVLVTALLGALAGRLSVASR